MKIVGLLVGLFMTSVIANASQFHTHFRSYERHQLREIKPGLLSTGKIAWSPYWTEMVASWKSFDSFDTGIRITAKLGGKTVEIAKWSLKEHESRTSTNDQKSDIFTMYTDTLVLKSPIEFIEVYVEPLKPGALVDLEELYISFAGGKISAPLWVNPKDVQAPQPEVPKSSEIQSIEPLDVPKRAQMNYKGGNVLCSPASLSMVLAYWAKKLERPEIDNDVPQVQASVYDKAYKGTGNWAFNTAFAGSISGMKGYVTRLRDVKDLEKWLMAGVPVITSVSYDLLKGKEKKSNNDGHLVVLVGFSPNGELIFNDPGRGVVRFNYKLDDFKRAWASSKNTVYLVYPRVFKSPFSDENAPWQ